MKIGRQYLGRVCEVVWRDPKWDRVVSVDTNNRSDIPRGMAALARWREYGVIDDITEGVIRIVHSAGDCAGRNPASTDADEYVCTWVPEALVETIRVFVVQEEASDERREVRRE